MMSNALKLAKHGTVTIITKRKSSDSNTAHAQGGVAAVFDPKDSFEQHVQDAFLAGAGLCRSDSTRLVIEQTPERILELLDFGVGFTETASGKFDLGREGGHHFNRIVHVKDHTGYDIEQALVNAVKKTPNIIVLKNHSAIDLITEHHIFSLDRAKDYHLHSMMD